MLLLLRKLKHDQFMKKKTRKYLLYAVGELLLIIIGILIALQIDNWNTERQEVSALRGYLNVIATNLRSDLAEAERLHLHHVDRHEACSRAFAFVRPRSNFDVADIYLAQFALRMATESRMFEATTSGYEALKVSGTLSRMQGRDIERLLFEYYDIAARIAATENAYNASQSALLRQFLTDWPAGILQTEFFNPEAVRPPRFAELQPLYRSIIDSPTAEAIGSAVFDHRSLILQYENLILRGRTLMGLIETGEMNLDEARASDLASMYEPFTRAGYPNLITEGRIAWHAYQVESVAEDFYQGLEILWPNHETLRRIDNSLHIINPGGVRWAVVYLWVPGIAEERPSLDFSDYDKLRLELKGDKGGEVLHVHMKDKYDPDDGSQTNIEVRLSDRWEVYEIDLDEFVTADLSQLHVPLGFLFSEEASSFSMRDARFVKQE